MFRAIVVCSQSSAHLSQRPPLFDLVIADVTVDSMGGINPVLTLYSAFGSDCFYKLTGEDKLIGLEMIHIVPVESHQMGLLNNKSLLFNLSPHLL